ADAAADVDDALAALQLQHQRQVMLVPAQRLEMRLVAKTRREMEGFAPAIFVEVGHQIVEIAADPGIGLAPRDEPRITDIARQLVESGEGALHLVSGQRRPAVIGKARADVIGLGHGNRISELRRKSGSSLRFMASIAW